MPFISGLIATFLLWDFYLFRPLENPQNIDFLAELRAEFLRPVIPRLGGPNGLSSMWLPGHPWVHTPLTANVPGGGPPWRGAP